MTNPTFTTDLNEARRGDTITFRSPKYNNGRKVCAAVESVDNDSGEIVFVASNGRSRKALCATDMTEIEFTCYR